ncbi:uncharacterized protein BXZ73DRAFT_106036 [Epithele typhae]|uniref:uncharacterized protein n=1 Tax=Epithele typhae TaxID=378194 RepID=UPI0020077CBF|nr:uncharacterized protein BXZ73DRAFT_106036 [Epithele typhae]KAH9915969.1 hypothetical protein BXZ73DRAFT_106036 [Epithele typhae]
MASPPVYAAPSALLAHPALQVLLFFVLLFVFWLSYAITHRVLPRWSHSVPTLALLPAARPHRSRFRKMLDALAGRRDAQTDPLIVRAVAAVADPPPVPAIVISSPRTPAPPACGSAEGDPFADAHAHAVRAGSLQVPLAVAAGPVGFDGGADVARSHWSGERLCWGGRRRRVRVLRLRCGLQLRFRLLPLVLLLLLLLLLLLRRRRRLWLPRTMGVPDEDEDDDEDEYGDEEERAGPLRLSMASSAVDMLLEAISADSDSWRSSSGSSSDDYGEPEPEVVDDARETVGSVVSVAVSVTDVMSAYYAGAGEGEGEGA